MWATASRIRQTGRVQVGGDCGDGETVLFFFQISISSLEIDFELDGRIVNGGQNGGQFKYDSG